MRIETARIFSLVFWRENLSKFAQHFPWQEFRKENYKDSTLKAKSRKNIIPSPARSSGEVSKSITMLWKLSFIQEFREMVFTWRTLIQHGSYKSFLLQNCTEKRVCFLENEYENLTSLLCTLTENETTVCSLELM